MPVSESLDDPLVRCTSTQSAPGVRSVSSNGPKGGSSSLEELLYYKGQPALFYPARLQPADLVGAFFPSKLAKAFSMAQVLTGLLLLSLGIVALLVQASLSSWGGGIWAGGIILLTGVAGLLASARPASAPHIVTFLILSLFAVAASGLLVVLAATGLATDSNTPPAHYVDDQGQRVDFLGEVSAKGALAANGVLLVLSILACLLSIGCCVMSAREACQCYGTFASSDSSCLQGSDTDMRRDRLLSWLGQQAAVSMLPPGRAQLVCAAIPKNKWSPEQKQTPPKEEDPEPTSVSSKSTVPSRLSSYVEPPEIVKVDDKYLAIDKKMAEDYIERLLETDEKRLSATYEVIAQEARNSIKKAPKSK